MTHILLVTYTVRATFKL